MNKELLEKATSWLNEMPFSERQSLRAIFGNSSDGYIPKETYVALYIAKYPNGASTVSDQEAETILNEVCNPGGKRFGNYSKENIIKAMQLFHARGNEGVLAAALECIKTKLVIPSAPDQIKDDCYKIASEALATYKQDGWISVETRLPETGEFVQVCLEYGTVLQGRLMNNGWVAIFRDGEELINPSNPEHRQVTHWQPLPEPPSNK